MSIVAEFAAKLHEQTPRAAPRACEPVEYPSAAEHLYDIRAVIFDVYGTLVDYRKGEFGDREATERSLLAAFGALIERFGVREHLLQMDAAAEPSRTLSDVYQGLIALDHQRSRRRDIETPEVRIDRVWGLILMMLKRHGFQPSALGLGEDPDVARCMAYFYNFHALGRGFYPGVVDALARLRGAGVALGILSNAQFYTPIDLTLFARDQSDGRCDDYLELFDSDLVFYSYEYRVSKPGRLLFEKLYNALYELQILPSQTVFVGNSLAADIEPARSAGMKTAFYCGDRRSAFLGDLAGSVTPDIAFHSYDELPARIHLHGAGKEH